MKTAFITLISSTLLLLSFTKPKKPVTTLDGMKKAMKSGYAYVPTGSVNFEGKTISIQGFFILKTEISNFDYREYLSALKLAGKTDEYTAALPDTLGWRTSLSFGEKYTDYYLRHPAYKDYPVVNITKAQAEKYCEWLTRVWREKTGNESIVFRLPTRIEYLKAAWGNSSGRTYAWESPYLFDEKGMPRCNFLNIGAASVTRDSISGEFKVVKNYYHDSYAGNLSDNADLTAPVKSFYCNELGIYNLNGNVSEMVAEDGIAVGGDWNSPGYDVRNESTKAFTKANPMVGFRPVMTFVETK
jgi:formylglycine-generating enzyme required for sulfatase activity